MPRGSDGAGAAAPGNIHAGQSSVADPYPVSASSGGRAPSNISKRSTIRAPGTISRLTGSGSPSQGTARPADGNPVAIPCDGLATADGSRHQSLDVRPFTSAVGGGGSRRRGCRRRRGGRGSPSTFPREGHAAAVLTSTLKAHEARQTRRCHAPHATGGGAGRRLGRRVRVRSTRLDKRVCGQSFRCRRPSSANGAQPSRQQVRRAGWQNRVTCARRPAGRLAAASRLAAGPRPVRCR
jgi:hypothetical protein